MITFHRRLFIMLTTIFVVSFTLLGFFLSASLTEQINHSEKNNLKDQAEQLYFLMKDDQHAAKHIQTYNEYASDKILVKRKGQTIFKSQSLNIDDLNKKLSPWNDNFNERLTYHYFNKDEEALLIYARGDYEIFIQEPLSDIKQINYKVWEFLLLLLSIVLPVIYIIVRYINKSYIEPINEVTYASRLLAEGNYKVRVPESSVSETKDLYISTNILARTLQSLNNEEKLQRNRLETTLQNIPSAILLVDKFGKVVITNDTYQRLFNKGNPTSVGPYNEVIAQEQVKRMIREAIATEKPINETITLLVSVHEKHFDAAVVPVLSKRRKKLEGVVIVLHDITQLKTLEQMRKDFVANVSHELKTPITSIKGFSETLLDGAKNDPTSLDLFLDIILKEANRIQVLVSELLELSKIEQNTQLVLTTVNMTEKVKHSIEVVQPLADKKNIQVEAYLEENCCVKAEPSKLKQVVINLLSNAVNYSPEETKIVVKLFTEGEDCILEVIDEGMGIAEEEQVRIFERFYRVDKARSRDSGGTGLGLAIVKHIVDAFNGLIDVESEIGKGSTFRVILTNVPPDKKS